MQVQKARWRQLMKFDREQLNAALADTADVVLANDNSAGQVVISGTPEGVESIISQVKIKRVMMLNVSGAFHSPLVQSASEQFLEVLNSVQFQEAEISVLSNTEPNPTTDSTQLKSRLAQQMTGAVRWREIMLQFSQLGIEKVVEVGPGKALKGLIKRTCPEISLEGVGTLEQLQSFEEYRTKELMLT